MKPTAYALQYIITTVTHIQYKKRKWFKTTKYTHTKNTSIACSLINFNLSYVFCLWFFMNM